MTKILISSHFFAPSVGGIEQVGGVLAEEWTRLGHEVRVVTTTPAGDGARETGFAVVREPALLELVRLVQWCDVYFHNNISLQTVWPLVFVHRPWVVAHHTWISRLDGRIAWRDRLKRFLLRGAANIAVSDALARSLSVEATVIGNPYRDQILRCDRDAIRTRDLVFVGRLVSDKGADLLLEALGLLKQLGHSPRLTVIGSGPEESNLRRQCDELGLNAQVEFAGPVSGRELAARLNQHRIMVVPSRWSEPFGLVALEAIACGCFVIGSEQGGLKDAIGPCGVTFPNGDVAALTACLAEALRAEDGHQSYLNHAAAHLAKHRPAAVAKRYLEVFEAAIRER